MADDRHASAPPSKPRERFDPAYARRLDDPERLKTALAARDRRVRRARTARRPRCRLRRRNRGVRGAVCAGASRLPDRRRRYRAAAARHLTRETRGGGDPHGWTRSADRARGDDRSRFLVCRFCTISASRMCAGSSPRSHRTGERHSLTGTRTSSARAVRRKTVCGVPQMRNASSCTPAWSSSEP